MAVGTKTVRSPGILLGDVRAGRRSRHSARVGPIPRAGIVDDCDAESAVADGQVSNRDRMFGRRWRPKIGCDSWQAETSTPVGVRAESHGAGEVVEPEPRNLELRFTIRASGIGSRIDAVSLACTMGGR